MMLLLEKSEGPKEMNVPLLSATKPSSLNPPENGHLRASTMSPNKKWSAPEDLPTQILEILRYVKLSPCREIALIMSFSSAIKLRIVRLLRSVKSSLEIMLRLRGSSRSKVAVGLTGSTMMLTIEGPRAGPV